MIRKLSWILTILIISQPFCANAKPMRIGTTFSPVQCEYLKQDWKKVYIKILDMGFDIVRLGAYWDKIEKEKDIYDFSDLDWQIKEAKKRKTAVLLTVGMKAPRWPEYHIPGWVLKKVDLKFGQDVSRNAYLRERTVKFIEEVVGRYENDPTLQCWQVENEPLDRSGEHYWWIGKKFLTEEVALVKKLDPLKRPIVINVATYPNKFLHFLARLFAPEPPITDSLSLCDILGLNIYPTVGHEFFRKKMYFWTHPWERVECFARIIKRAKLKGKKIWITELQAEPWEPGELVHMDKEGPKTIWPEMIKNAFCEIESLGIDAVFLWGAEYWFYRKTRYEDKSWLERAKNLVSS